MLRIFLWILLSVISASVWAATESPIFKPYPEARINNKQVWDFGQFEFPIGLPDSTNPSGDFPSIEAQGDFFWQWQRINNVSSLKVFENYKQAALSAGFEVIFECELQTCGTDAAVKQLGALLSPNANVYNYYRNPYYVVLKKPAENGHIYVAWFVGAYEDEVGVQQALLVEEPLQTGLVQVDTGQLASDAMAPSAASISDKERARDNPLLPRYPGAAIHTLQKTDSEKVTVYPAPNDSAQTSIELLGDVSKHFYQINNVSSLKVYENYKAALMAAGFTMQSSCELQACGASKAVQGFGEQMSVTENFYNYYRNPYYILAVKGPAGEATYIALFIGAYDSEVGVFQTIVQEQALATGLVTVAADQLQQQLESQGKALIYGIYFDTGKAQIKPESKPQLDAIAQLLRDHQELNLYVVGHTDDTGARAANEQLASARAQAVVAELTAEYQIPSSQLVAKGVGPYAPASNNTSDEGKQQNRRVELVKRLN